MHLIEGTGSVLLSTSQGPQPARRDINVILGRKVSASSTKPVSLSKLMPWRC